MEDNGANIKNKDADTTNIKNIDRDSIIHHHSKLMNLYLCTNPQSRRRDPPVSTYRYPDGYVILDNGYKLIKYHLHTYDAS
jgi:hypothetical protein